MPRLILFDIDETLIVSSGAGRRSVERAMLKVLGHPLSLDGHSLSGKTDPQIFAEVMIPHGYSQSDVDRSLPRLLDTYVLELEEELKIAEGARVHAGVNDILRILEEREDAYLGLLTGNIERGARIKLGKFNLNDYFCFGAFGCDSADRMRLPAVAHRRAHEVFQRKFDIKDIVIIGDARNDVLCASGYGARSLAVCTGKTTKEELLALNPDYLFDSLKETGQVLDAIFAS